MIGLPEESPSESIDIAREDSGGGPFWVIMTERWTFNHTDDLIALLRAADEKLRIEKVTS